MRIRLFTNIYFAFIILIFSLLIMLASCALSTLEDITGAERQKYRSLQLASELFHSSEDLTKMARSYVVTGEPIYERFFFQILDIRNGKRPRPEAHLVNYWVMDSPLTPTSGGSAIPLVELMRREGFSERELALLQQSQKNSDDLVKLERQAFAAIKGACGGQHGNLAPPCAARRDFAINLLFGERYKSEKARIMAPISQFMLELDNRTQATLSRLQSQFHQQILLMLAVLCIALLIAAAATFYMRGNILRPLDYLRRQASSIAQGSYSTRCDISTRNELAELGADFNTMADAIEREITKLKQVEGSLRERLKEINCFYAIRRGMESSSLEEVCEIIFAQLITAMQFPHLTSVKIELDGKEFTSDEYESGSPHKLQKQVLVYGEACGWITIFYSEDKPFLLPEEQNLIDVIGDDLGKWLEHKKAEARMFVEQELRVRSVAIREFAAHVERMREEDRKYIAREIHDELGQLLAALHLEISLLKTSGKGKSNKIEKMEVIRRNMAELVDRANQSVRSVAEHLRPASLGLGIEPALKRLTDEFRKYACISCALQLIDEPIDLDEDQTVAIFRIVQESLTNVARHAGASHVEVSLSRSADHLVIEVRDDGKGFDAEGATKQKSFGLVGMRERAAVLGGNIEVLSGLQQGTAIRVRLPVKRNEEAHDHQGIPRG